uniref:hypothetical protein n=1 Tax=Porphyromonas uenonis TaxID=281920 RepID=UPI0026EA092F
ILPKFYFILPKFYFTAPWKIFISSLDISDFLGRKSGWLRGGHLINGGKNMLPTGLYLIGSMSVYAL